MIYEMKYKNALINCMEQMEQAASLFDEDDEFVQVLRKAQALVYGDETEALKAFLRRKGAWDAYCKNRRTLCGTTERVELACAFTWAESPEGHDYWQQLEEEFVEWIES